MRTAHNLRAALIAAAIAIIVAAPITGAAAASAATADAAGATTAAAAAPAVVINEIESSGGVPGDWVELKNMSAAAVDVSGWSLLDDNDAHTAVPLPAGTTIDAGGYLVVEEATLGFGLGAPDAARLFDAGHALVDSYSWTAHAETTYGRCPDGTGGFVTTAVSTKGAANACGAAPVANHVVINEVVSTGGTPGDWIELANSGSTAADVSGYVLRDDTDSHSFTIPAGTTIAAGGHLAEDVEAAFGLGKADSARLFLPDGTTLLDSYSWTEHAATSYGRCPDASGAFTTTSAVTKGAANACGDAATAAAWPGGSDIRTVDAPNVFGENLSGLVYQASGTATPGVLWAVRNGPSTLYRLVWNGTNWVPDASNGWANGKSLKYPDGTGDPDAEGVTRVTVESDASVYVSTERNNEANTVSRPEVLRFDTSQPGTVLSATNEWNLTSDLPGLGANLGAEGVAWVPDSYLTAHGFIDERTGVPYTPGAYLNHGEGLFFVGIEATGTIYAYALNNSTEASTRVATISSGFPGVMEVQFDQERQALWAVCDDSCNGRTATLTIASTGAQQGHFTVQRLFERPAGMPNFNNEGFVAAPQAECVNGLKPVVWSDDTNDGGHALRAGTIECTVVAGGGTGSGPGDGSGGADPTPAMLHLSGATVAAGSTLSMTGTGFTAGERVEIVLHSAPVTVGTVTADASGAIAATVTIPAATVPGQHTLTVTALTSGATASVPLTVTAATGTVTGRGTGGTVTMPAATTGDPAASADSLARTGSTVETPLVAALLALALGGGLLLVRRRRRAHSS